MKTRRLFVPLVVILALLVLTTNAFSTTSASLMFMEENLGSDEWRYDGIITNTSDSGEQLYMFLLDFGQAVNVNGSTLPTAWYGTVWDGTDVSSSYIDAMSINPVTYINAGDSLTGFSFRADTQLGELGELSYHAEFINASSIVGTASIAVAPEPVSTVLFLAGGATMAFRYRQKRKRLLS